MSVFGSAIPLKTSQVIRIASANVECHNNQTKGLVARFTQLEPDILLVLEWTKQNPPAESLPEMHLVTSEFHMKRGFGLFIHKKWLSKVEVRPFYSSIRQNTRCLTPMCTLRLHLNHLSITLLGIHIPPPHINGCRQFTNATIQEIANFIENGQLKEALAAGVQNDPVLIIGDFNAHPFNSHLRQFSEKGLQDVFKRNGVQFYPTWPMRLSFIPGLSWFPFVPLFRIDYIWLSKVIKFRHYGCLNLPGSDHRAVFIDLSIHQ